MPVDLREMLVPTATAVLTMELQRSVVGDLSSLPALQVEIEPRFPTIRRLLSGAREASVPVVHCVAGRSSVPSARPNYPLAAALARRRAEAPDAPPPDPGLVAQGEEIVPAIGPHPSDIRVARGHGVTPFTGTELDSVLRLLHVETVVAAGVSLNMGIIGLTLEAVGLGYRVAVVTDAVAGTPRDYGEAVLQNTLRLAATLVTTDQLLEAWS
jgi:nicotinamidase-related amidase